MLAQVRSDAMPTSGLGTGMRIMPPDIIKMLSPKLDANFDFAKKKGI